MGSYKWGYKSPNMGYNYSYLRGAGMGSWPGQWHAPQPRAPLRNVQLLLGLSLKGSIRVSIRGAITGLWSTVDWMALGLV